MPDLIIVVLVLAGLGTFFGFIAMFADTYGSDLEKYIVSRNPQHAGDVERLTVEYNQKQAKRDLHL
jgi:hypothetical protein